LPGVTESRIRIQKWIALHVHPQSQCQVRNALILSRGMISMV
jgi:hypothetical protein